eukprot:CAMPEP_0170628424 /NCGR_PEP_ID=MMETSP0224-20130122/32673_1 /TAXON_ID=285029 /ORGANISM="Togula jolla, Strain CCCM 725" /LENGTH=441 /DNA_ID=CAMNT_0010955841 /DNA_START=18 /DNA_END=1343 /DNA_ORIENTATION=+
MLPVEDKALQQMQATGARVLQNSPGLPEKLVAASKAQSKPTGAVRDDQSNVIADLRRQLETERDKNRSLEDQYKYRIASFVKRETQTKNKIEVLERRLNEGSDQDEHVQRMAVIDTMHKSVVSGLECIQNNTAKILQDQEKDLMRAFRARLQEVSKELEAARNRKGEHSTELQARHRRVVAELHEAQELAQTFDKKNQQLAAENQKLLEKLCTREDDRQALLRELVFARKETARLKAQVKDGMRFAPVPDPSATTGGDAAARELDSSQSRRRSFSQKQIEQARLQQTHNKQYEREVRYREAVQRLKRMVEAERKLSRALKQQQADMLQQRTELEVLLQQCLDDVKAEIVRRKQEPERKEGTPVPGIAPSIAAVSASELNSEDRERVLELLLSQQRVVQLLYSKTFPAHMATSLNEPVSPAPGQRAQDDDFSWLSDIIPPEG